MQTVSYDSLTDSQKQLLDGAAKAVSTSYSPYSQFSVGAALLTIKGKIVTASNVENAAYSGTICAERAAIVRANAMGHRHFQALAVIAQDAEEDTADVTPPCGACRQMLYEFASLSGRDIEIILSTTDKKKIVLTSAGELLPMAFGPSIDS
jgi:cytidine deaminase